MKDGENRMSFIKGAEITYGKAGTMYLALALKLKNVVELKVWTDMEVMRQVIGHKKVASKLKRDNFKKNIYPLW